MGMPIIDLIISTYLDGQPQSAKHACLYLACGTADIHDYEPPVERLNFPMSYKCITGKNNV